MAMTHAKIFVGRAYGWLLLSIVLAPVTASAQYQGGEGRVPPPMSSGGILPSNLIPTTPSPASVPIPPDLKVIGINIPLPTLMTQGEGKGNEDLISDVIEFNSALDDLLPYCGCNNVVNWPAYNDAVKAAKQLRRSLKAAVATEKKSFPANASQQQIEAVLKRLNAVDEITSALEKATSLLTLLSKSLQEKH